MGKQSKNLRISLENTFFVCLLCPSRLSVTALLLHSSGIAYLFQREGQMLTCIFLVPNSNKLKLSSESKVAQIRLHLQIIF